MEIDNAGEFVIDVVLLKLPTTGMLEIAIGEQTRRRPIADESAMHFDLSKCPQRLTARSINPAGGAQGVNYVTIRRTLD